MADQRKDENFAVEALRNVESSIDSLTSKFAENGITLANNFDFFRSAREVLVRGRRVARNAYIHGFFLGKGPELALFEHQQTMMESNLESLASLLGDSTISLLTEGGIDKPMTITDAWEKWVNQVTALSSATRQFVDDIVSAQMGGDVSSAAAAPDGSASGAASAAGASRPL